MEYTQYVFTTMIDYSHPMYKNLYKEILIDYNYRFPKYCPIGYPSPGNSGKPILKERPQFPPTK